MVDPFSIGASAAAQQIFDAARRAISKKWSGKSTVKAWIDEDKFARNQQIVADWCSIIHVAGMAEPIDLMGGSIPLNMSSVQRRFRIDGAKKKSFSEEQLVAGKNHIALLGDPGSGKTTTLKRVCANLYGLLEAGESDATYPIVVLCRRVDWESRDLEQALVEELGLRGEKRVKSRGEETTQDLTPAELTDIAISALDESGAVILIDGLDEIAERSKRNAVANTIERLGSSLRSTRIIASCRSAEAPFLSGFSTAELLPLETKQVKEIVNSRVKSSRAFFRSARASGSEELTDRPLFLNQMLIVYERMGRLPEQPSGLCKQMVRLLLTDWDEQRRIVRHSKYGGFDVDAKSEFLAQLAYDFIQTGQKVFTEGDLIDFYEQKCELFLLPPGEAVTVVREIQSHVGLIVETGGGFEFSHLTIQEYLCADNIIRRPIDREVSRLVSRYPAVIAIATALSADPSLWLYRVLEASPPMPAKHYIGTFVARLGQEQPRFAVKRELGDAVLSLIDQDDGADLRVWKDLSSIESVRDSLRWAISEGYFCRRRGGDYRLAAAADAVELGRVGRSGLTVPGPLAELFRLEDALEEASYF